MGPSLGRAAKDHLDWMFEQDDQTLQTWETPLVASFVEPMTVPTQRLNDHRIAYLDREGPLGGDRGEVTRVISGEYQQLTIRKESIRLKIAWRWDESTNTAQLDFYRNAADESSRRDVNDDGWRLRISPLR